MVDERLMKVDLRMKSIVVLILAAGASSRLGQPKQLLRVGDKTLLAQICEIALALETRQVVVVLGAHCEAIRPAIGHLPVGIVVNEAWETGMGSTLACGMSHLPSDVEAVLVLLCDQPLVTPAFLEKLLARWHESTHPIVASAYAGTFGPPAVFSRELFGELAALQGQQGAKRVMQLHDAEMELVDFPEGAFDVDTPEDLAGWRNVI